MPRTGSSLSPDRVEFVAKALVRCQEFLAADPQFRYEADEHDAALTRILMRVSMAGDRDVDALATKAVQGFRLALRLRAQKS
ncbi:MAG: hypothetical protein Q7T81_02185 [Pseudolabrys sp.]|nr:hypothetical protein [Pseudolabrys sp.]